MQTTQRLTDTPIQQAINQLQQKASSAKRMFGWTSLFVGLALGFATHTWKIIPEFSAGAQMGYGLVYLLILYVFIYALRLASRNWKGNAQLKKDIQQGEKQVVNGKISSISPYKNGLKVEVNQQSHIVYPGYSFRGIYRISAAVALLHEKVGALLFAPFSLIDCPPFSKPAGDK